MSIEAMKQALEALNCLLTEPMAKTAANKAESLLIQAAPGLRKAIAQAEQAQPVAASQKDAVFAASIDFIGSLTGMTPPPIETAPLETFKPFRDFTEKVCSIFSTAPPPRKPLTDEQIGKAWAVATGEHNASAVVKRRVTRAIEAAHGIKG